MANFDHYYISGTKQYSTANQSYCAVAKLTQTIDRTNRKVTVTVRGLLGCYRNGAWNPGTNTKVFATEYTIKCWITGKDESSAGGYGLYTGNPSISMVAGGTYTYDLGLDTGENKISNGCNGLSESQSVRSISNDYYYNDDGDAITGSFYVTVVKGSVASTVSGSFATSSIEPKYSDPKDLDVSVSSKTDTSVTLVVSVTDYGYPPSATGRYLQAAILGTSTYGEPYRYANLSNVASGSTTISNSSSTGSSPLTLAGNTEYYYGALANNTHNEVSIVKGTVVTRPAYITSVTATDNGHGSMSFTINHAAEGSKYTVTDKYSLDGGSTWINISGTLTLNLTGPTTIKFKRVSSAGETSVYSGTFTPHFNRYVYIGVGNKAKKAKKIYIGVNGQSKEVKKVYVGVGGVAKLAYEKS